jgi:ribosomal protein S25
MCNEVTTTLTGHIELVTCRLGKLDLKLKEQHMAGETVIAANKDLKATCKEYENHNSRLRRKLTEAIRKEVCFICWISVTVYFSAYIVILLLITIGRIDQG